jgi:hypothetical protein
MGTNNSPPDQLKVKNNPLTVKSLKSNILLYPTLTNFRTFKAHHGPLKLKSNQGSLPPTLNTQYNVPLHRNTLR